MSRASLNGAIFDPREQTLILLVNVKDVKVFHESDGMLSIAIDKFNGGIDIVHDGEELWWPV